MHIKKVKLFSSVISCLFLTGCMSTTIDDAIDTSKKESEQIKKKGEQKEETTENGKLSKEQLEILDKLEKRPPEDIIKDIPLDERVEATPAPLKKEHFDDPTELSQYIAYLFYEFNSGKISAEQYLSEILPYSHPHFLVNKPNKKEEQLIILKDIQQRFKEQLRAPIASYVLTNVEYDERIEEAFFYRKYVLENKEEIFYITTLKKVDEEWKVFSDDPSTPYTSVEFLREKTKKEGEK